MSRLLLSLVLALVGIGLAPLRANADAIALNTWYEFSFGDPGTALGTCGGSCIAAFNPYDGNPVVVTGPDSPWTVATSGPATLKVQDLFQSVDQFDMSDNGVDLGLTSAPTPGSDCGGDITCSWLNLDFSRGNFLLGGGAHSITGVHTLGIPGAAVFEVTTVPEPSTWALMVIGFLGLGFAGYRTAKSRAAAAA